MSLHRILLLVLIAASFASVSEADDSRLERISYNNPDLVVDLGVGLWAWPLPMDYDRDGDLDLVVSCPDLPYRGTYFFENPGPSRLAATEGSANDPALPVFKPAVRIADRMSNVQISYVGDEPVVTAPGKIFVDFRSNHYDKAIELPLPQKIDPQYERYRANQWKLVDWEGDGDLDLVIGIGIWDDYGWDDAWDEDGNWKNGPLHGFVYFVENVAVGRGASAGAEVRELADDQPWPEFLGPRPAFVEPFKIEAGGEPVDVYGMPSPNLADFDGDGDLDLLCGEFLDGFTYFENEGTLNRPVWKAGERLVTRELRDASGQVESWVSPPTEIEMDLQMITPVAVDWDQDGAVDIISGDEDGRVALLRNWRLDGYEARRGEEIQSHAFGWPVYFQQQAADVKFGALATPVSYDWDGDGDEDLICGNTAGYLGFIENLGGGANPQWARPKFLAAVAYQCTFIGEAPIEYTIRHMAGERGSIQGPCEAKWGYTTLSIADWDDDGQADLLVNDIWGQVGWYRGVNCDRFSDEPGSDSETETADFPCLMGKRSVYDLHDVHGGFGGDGDDIYVRWSFKPQWTWWAEDAVRLNSQWRTTPCVVDWNGDELQDIVMLDPEGYLALYERIPILETRGSEDVRAPQRIFKIEGPCEFDSRHRPVGDKQDGLLRLNANRAGASGRRKLHFVDWDGDGRLDLLVNSVNANFLRNVRTDEEGFTWFHDEGPLDERVLAGHTTSPTTVDWDNNGIPDLLVGAEDGHLYYKRNPRARAE